MPAVTTRTAIAACIAALAVAAAFSASAASYVAGPEDYQALLPRLRPGDTLSLRSGTYRAGLRLHGIHGEALRPISIRGPRDAAAPATFIARPNANTVSLSDASYVAISDLVLDGIHVRVDAVKAESTGAPVHHITIERLTILRYDAAQDVIAISTKCPAWNWVIRDNTIIGAGTGMYLGNSDGAAPFFAGVIERNVIIDTIGYNIEIKHQAGRPPLEDAPRTPSVTTVRNNIFVKTRAATSIEMARPNLLVGHFPLEGPGRDDRYDVTGNLFYDNPSEALFQGEGNFVLEHNIFINPHGNAIAIQPHHDVPRDVSVAKNLVLARGTGIRVRGLDGRFEQSFAGNRIRAAMPLDGIDAVDNDLGHYTSLAAAYAAWSADDGAKKAVAALDARLLRANVCAPGTVNTTSSAALARREPCALLRKLSPTSPR